MTVNGNGRAAFTIGGLIGVLVIVIQLFFNVYAVASRNSERIGCVETDIGWIRDSQARVERLLRESTSGD